MSGTVCHSPRPRSSTLPAGPNPVQDPNVAWLEVEFPSRPKPVEFPSDQRVFELGAVTDGRLPPEQKVRARGGEMESGYRRWVLAPSGGAAAPGGRILVTFDATSH